MAFCQDSASAISGNFQGKKQKSDSSKFVLKTQNIQNVGQKAVSTFGRLLVQLRHDDARLGRHFGRSLSYFIFNENSIDYFANSRVRPKIRTEFSD